MTQAHGGGQTNTWDERLPLEIPGTGGVRVPNAGASNPHYNPLVTNVDQPQPDGYNVYSTVRGRIVFMGWNNPNDHEDGFGYYLRIEAEDGSLHYYAHLDEDFERGFRLGQRVDSGTFIGRLEIEDKQQGNSTAPHVHHEKRVWNDEGELVAVYPGMLNPLVVNSTMTVGYNELYEGGPNDTEEKTHKGVEFAPRTEGE